MDTASPAAAAVPPSAELDLALTGMTCAACATRIEKVLNRVPGVQAQVNFAVERAHVRFDPLQADTAALTAAVERAGYGAVPIDRAHPTQPVTDAANTPAQRYRRAFLLGAVFTLPLVAQMVGMATGRHEWMLPAWLQFALATPVQFWLGAPFYRGAFKSLRGGGANMDVLVALGTSVAWAFSTVMMWVDPHAHVYFESSATVITLVLLGKWLEARARARTGEAIAALVALQPATAQVERDGVATELPIDAIRPGDQLRLRPGEAFAVDGTVIDGESEADESMLTGESLPVAKAAGAQVYAGTLNGHGTLRVRATGVGASTALAGIVQLVQDAQGSKAPIQRLADKVSGVFVPVVLVIAVLTFAGWLLYGASLADATIAATAVLVIACPCALGLATPAAVMVGIGEGSRVGILIKDSAALERARQIDTLIVDKTGTLTQGRPQVTEVVAFAGSTAAEVLQVAAALETDSEHPLARAVRAAAAADAAVIARGVLRVTGFQAVPGRGVRALVDGEPALLGACEWLAGGGPDGESAATGAERAEHAGNAAALPIGAQWPRSDGRSWIGVARGGRALGALALADALRPDSIEAVARLQRAGIEVVMLSGDDAEVAARIAQQAGIVHFRGRCQPQDKAAEVRRLQAEGRVVGMAGDGVNDAPALAAADVSFAIGSGSGIALHTADVTLMSSRLSQVGDAIDLSRATLTKVRQNLFFAFVYNVLGIPLAAAGLLNPVVAGAAMAMSSVCVVANALTLKRWSARRRRTDAHVPAQT
jgi:P-type Cu+ transporter